MLESLLGRAARLTVVARYAERLRALGERLAIDTVAADVTDAAAARSIITKTAPGAVIFVAGATPVMGPIASISWEDFSTNWRTDTHGALIWIQAALNHPLKPGARFVTVSSGAAINGSPLSGGYGGAKRMQWLMTNYAGSYSQQAALGLVFQTFVPGQMIAGTATGDAGSRAYATRMGISPEQFIARFGKPLTPYDVGEAIIRVLTEGEFEHPRAFRMSGDEGLCVLEPAVA